MAIGVGSRSFRYSSGIQKRSGTAAVYNKSKAAGIVVDTADGYKLKYNKNGTVVTLIDSSAAGAGAGASVTGTLTVTESTIGGYLFRTQFALTDVLVSVADSTAGGGTKLYDFPAGGVTFLGGSFSLAPTTTSTIATTLKSGVTIEIGVGTVVGAGALTTTEENIIDGATGPSSTVINVAAAAIVGVRTTAPGIVDGHSTAADLLVNIGVPTGTDIDGDATVTLTGTIEVIWMLATDV